jgi:hypothetical protein
VTVWRAGVRPEPELPTARAAPAKWEFADKNIQVKHRDGMPDMFKCKLKVYHWEDNDNGLTDEKHDVSLRLVAHGISRVKVGRL